MQCQNEYAMCEKFNLLLQHWQKLSVTALVLLRYEHSVIFSVWNYSPVKFFNFEDNRFLHLHVVLPPLWFKWSGFTYWLHLQRPLE